jgi:glyoxylase-like metal-dependent hydrolase (beta-lactamase superfamily II)
VDPVKKLAQERPDFFANRPAHLEAPIQINDFIWMSPGLSAAYMLVTAAGRIIINTGMGFEAPVHKQAFDRVCPGPTPYILLTQGHVDHVGGVHVFREAATQLVAQANNGVCQRDDERIRDVRTRQAYIWFKEAMDASAKLAAQHPGAITQDVPVPDVVFEDRHRIELGGLEIELLSVPGGETVDSCAIWLPQHKILFSGNMFGPLFPHFPNFNTIRGDKYRFVEPYLESLRRVRALQPEMLITGRFDPIKGADLIAQCLDRLDAAVDYVHRQTLAGMNAGKDIWTLMREIQLPPELYVGQGYGRVPWAVRTLWESYMGWFKAGATSELYPTQASEIHGDLVALAGIGAVVARGRERLQAGDMEGGELMAEAALAHDSHHQGALQLSLDCHQALLERSGADNFWETGWLRTRIADLQARLTN